MIWKSIRLELAGTKEFPRGSPSRVYLLRLPLGQDGSIDETELNDLPARATVRRFWPSEPDLRGYVIRTPQGWGFTYDRVDGGDAPVFKIDAEALRLGDHVTLTEPDGKQLPFRVASLEQIN